MDNQVMSLDVAQLETYRPYLTGHCYRMLGSSTDAEDAVQETLVRAWQSLARFQGRASVKTWLYRIATNVCLDALSSKSRRMLSIEDGPVGHVEMTLDTRPRTHWLEPIPDARVVPDAGADPHEIAVLRQSTRLAFVAALQHLPPRQRAALLLTEVLGWSAAEVAESLEMTVAAVNSALQRARATLATRRGGRLETSLADDDAALLDRYLDAFCRYDVDALVSLLHEDATLSMPPYTLWLQGHDAIRAWLLGRGAHCCGSKMIETRACGVRAFAQYRPSPDGGYHAWAMILLERRDDRIDSWTSFLDVETLFPQFGLPLRVTD